MQIAPEPTRLEVARLLAKLRVVDVARRLGVSRATVDRWERGDSIPSSAQVEMLAGCLEVPMGFFFGPALPDIEYTSIDWQPALLKGNA